MDNFCRSSIVLKVRIRPINSTYMAIIKRMRIFKSSTSSASGSIGEKSTRDPIEDKHILIKLSEHGETRCYCPFAEVNTSSLSKRETINFFGYG
uniref:Kinesin motor domain-containing protein n=1 Tax=Meloidogyne javanica TaxID=6303 RepID=A0A915LUD3_MELJA